MLSLAFSVSRSRVISIREVKRCLEEKIKHALEKWLNCFPLFFSRERILHALYPKLCDAPPVMKK